MQVTCPLPPPILCDECASSNVELTTCEKAFGDTAKRWSVIYFCHDCKAAVGCHPGTKIPYGLMADRQTRRLRKKAHCAFDKLWMNKLMTRWEAYNWLARILKIPSNECHISWLSKDQLNIAIEQSTKQFEKYSKALIRRKLRHNEKKKQREYARGRQIKRHIKERKSKRKP